ncbi:MAG: hypothetical protein HRT88_10185 [Lentisphaeraceae bacterium]|nr:hypothetical protein [Lentisphaeraceae bacterium]
MTHVLAPEVSIDSNPLLVELCSEEFSLENHQLSFEEIENAADSIREACRMSTKAMSIAKSNILKAYMTQPKSRQWLRKKFLEKVDCDSSLLSLIARKADFKFYTNEKIVVEFLDNNGEESPAETVSSVTGVPSKIVERIINKIQKKKEEALAQDAVEEMIDAVQDDIDESEIPPVEEGEQEENTSLANSPYGAEDENAVDLSEVEPIAETPADSNDPEVERAKEVPSLDIVSNITQKVKAQLESDYLDEIQTLKTELNEKDAEIAKLREMLAQQDA